MVEEFNKPQKPDQIEHELAESRARMSNTLSALEARLNPQRLKREASQRVRRATVGRVEDFADNATESVKGASADVLETIKHNPLPAALAAFGLGWLFMESRQNKGMRRPARDYYNTDYAERPGYYEERGRFYGERSASDRMRGAAGEVQDRAGQAMSQVQDKAGEVASQVQDKASHVADQVQSTAARTADEVQYRAQQASTRFEQMIDENPLLVGAAALALGAALGLSLPGTQKENELLGETRDRVMDKAQEKAGDTLDKAQHVAERATDAAKEAAKDEARKQNLPTSST